MAVEQVNSSVGYQHQPAFKSEEKKSGGSPLMPPFLTGVVAGVGALYGLTTPPTEDTFVQSIKDGALKTDKFSDAQKASIAEIKTGIDDIPFAEVKAFVAEGAEAVAKDTTATVADTATKAKTATKSLLESLPEGLKTRVTTVFDELKETLPKVKNPGRATLIGAGVALVTYFGMKMFGGSDKGEA